MAICLWASETAMTILHLHFKTALSLSMIMTMRRGSRRMTIILYLHSKTALLCRFCLCLCNYDDFEDDDEWWWIPTLHLHSKTALSPSKIIMMIMMKVIKREGRRMIMIMRSGAKGWWLEIITCTPRQLSRRASPGWAPPSPPSALHPPSLRRWGCLDQFIIVIINCYHHKSYQKMSQSNDALHSCWEEKVF